MPAADRPSITPQSGGLWSAERRPLTVGLVLTITLVAVEALAVSTAMPIVAADLGGLELYGLVFSAFLVGSLVGIVIAGSLIDRVRRDRPHPAGPPPAPDVRHALDSVDPARDLRARDRRDRGPGAPLAA